MDTQEEPVEFIDSISNHEFKIIEEEQNIEIKNSLHLDKLSQNELLEDAKTKGSSLTEASNTETKQILPTTPVGNPSQQRKYFTEGIVEMDSHAAIKGIRCVYEMGMEYGGVWWGEGE
jgi:hypothetical protein